MFSMTPRQYVIFSSLFIGVLSGALFFPHLVDFPINLTLKNFQNPIIERMWDTVAYLGSGWLVVPVCLIIGVMSYWQRHYMAVEVSIRCFGSFVISGIAAQSFKHLLGRPRPRILNSESAEWGPSFVGGFDAFPSGHTTCAFALAAVLSHFYPRLRMAFFLLACLVGIARIIRGSHWVTDVVAGALLGTAIGILVSTLQLRKMNPSS